MRRLMFCVVCVFAIGANAFGGVFTPDEQQARNFLSEEFGIEVRDIFQFDLFVGDVSFPAWSFGGLRMDYDVSGLLDPNAVVNFATTDHFVGVAPDVLVKPIGDVFELGETIGSSVRLTETTFYPTIPNKPFSDLLLFGAGITDPNFGWIQVSLPGGLGTAPTIHNHAFQPVQNVPIAAGVAVVPEPSTITLLFLGAVTLVWRRRRRAG